MDENDEEAGGRNYLCIRDCYEGDVYYEKGKTYPISPLAQVAKHFKIPAADTEAAKATPKGAKK